MAFQILVKPVTRLGGKKRLVVGSVDEIRFCDRLLLKPVAPNAFGVALHESSRVRISPIDDYLDGRRVSSTELPGEIAAEQDDTLQLAGHQIGLHIRSSPCRGYFEIPGIAERIQQARGIGRRMLYDDAYGQPLNVQTHAYTEDKEQQQGQEYDDNEATRVSANLLRFLPIKAMTRRILADVEARQVMGAVLLRSNSSTRVMNASSNVGSAQFSELARSFKWSGVPSGDYFPPVDKANPITVLGLVEEVRSNKNGDAVFDHRVDV